jgi:CheY-like chemotaxis protein
MANLLILEDNPARQKQFKRKFIGHLVTIVDDSKEAIKLLDEAPEGHWDTIFLDHDLGGEQNVPSGEGTGYEVATWLERNPKKQPYQIILHSLNTAGCANMKRALPNSIVIPFAWREDCTTI